MSELPREKLLKYGPKNLTIDELLAIIIRKGTKDKNVFQLSKEITEKYSLKDLFYMNVNQLSQIKGIGKVTAITLKAVFELGIRFHKEALKKENIKLDSPDKVYDLIYDRFIFEDRENVLCISLNSKLNPISIDTISIGTANHSILHPRDIFKTAIKNNAISIILIHNHPSGDSTPSMQDYDITEKIEKSGELLGIKLSDHIIIGKSEYYSFKLGRKVIRNG
ncbi:DNA repair protein radc [Marinitoga piezophila KA3]|uniref:DNA repair protein radc n=1 Tax=Marinitoga piezophila (strain DSM 14283 / JCM 11233 / KA3) TaxID=443254 RepID=H2J3A1_MARPK|nr:MULTISPECIES: DNA repair protein RadC [Marinitoga]AEX85717.1 DNA repair protein radc [Marinitoga piezophila KA3]APT76169.1 DNA repair protein RadC [Marinitoga sp. 1137]